MRREPELDSVGGGEAWKVAYHIGDDLLPKTVMSSGLLRVEPDRFTIWNGSSSLVVRAETLTAVELVRIQGTMRMIKVLARDLALFVTVYRLNLGGRFLIVNFLAAGSLHKQLRALLPPHAGQMKEERHAH